MNDLRDQMKKWSRLERRFNLKLATGLWEVRSKALYIGWGFRTFESYCVSELLLQKRCCQYLVQIYDVLVKDMRISPEIVEATPSYSLRLIARLDIDRDKAIVLCKMAQQMSTRDFEASLDLPQRQLPATRFRRFSMVIPDSDHDSIMDSWSLLMEMLATNDKVEIMHFVLSAGIEKAERGHKLQVPAMNLLPHAH